MFMVVFQNTNYKDNIEKKTDEKLIVQEDWGKYWSRIYIEKNEGKMTDELKEWAIEKMVLFIEFLNPKIEELSKLYK